MGDHWTTGWQRPRFRRGAAGRHRVRVDLRVCLGLLGLVLLILTAGCSGRRSIPPTAGSASSSSGALDSLKVKPYQIDGVWYYPLPTAVGYREEGLASWYGRKFHGRRTASGERYNMYHRTAAHKTLPLGTVVRVTHLRNHRSVEVVINDRGPFVKGRIIDLSYGAAKALGLVGEGVAKVRVETVLPSSDEGTGSVASAASKPAPAFAHGVFTVQVGAFQDRDQAMKLSRSMASTYRHVRVNSFLYHGVTYYRVRVGQYDDLTQARGAMGQLKQKGFPDAFVVALEEK